MKADPDQHLSSESDRSGFTILKAALALAIIAGLAFYWFQSNKEKTRPGVAAPPTITAPSSQSGVPETPDIPRRSDPVTAGEGGNSPSASAQNNADDIALTDASALAPIDGDSMLRRELTVTGTNQIMSKLMSNAHPIDVSAAFIDGLGRGVILRKLLPGNPPKQAFSVMKEGDIIYISPSSYQRYDGYTDALTAIDSKQLVSSFDGLRPMYEQAFEYLGLNPNDFDNSVIRALDLVLATPVITAPIALEPKSVVYTFADPDLESLPAVQKQLLRMGPDNLSRIKQQARALRAALLDQ